MLSYGTHDGKCQKLANGRVAVGIARDPDPASDIGNQSSWMYVVVQEIQLR